MEIEEGRLYETQRAYREELMAPDGVHGVGIGVKHVAGELVDQIAIAVLVEQKIPESDLAEGQLIPTELDGVPTDVLESPTIELAGTPPGPYQSQYRPLIGGIQIQGGSAVGTLGFIAETTGGVRVAVSKQQHQRWPTCPYGESGLGATRQRFVDRGDR